jgi:hypothetical protein
MVCCEIYSTQISADDPVYIDDVESLSEILDMIEAIPIEDYMLVDLYLDINDLNDPIFQVSHSICGCRSLERIKTFVQEAWCIIENGGYI